MSLHAMTLEPSSIVMGCVSSSQKARTVNQALSALSARPRHGSGARRETSKASTAMQNTSSRIIIEQGLQGGTEAHRSRAAMAMGSKPRSRQ